MSRPNDVGVGVAALIIRDKKILLLKRKGSHSAGKWAVPGGWVDRKDTHPTETLSREILEETGLRVRSAHLYSVTSEDHLDLDCRTVTIYSQVFDTGGKPEILESEKCSEMRWFGWKEICEIDYDSFFPQLYEILCYLYMDRSL